MKNKEKIFRHNNLRKSNLELLRLVAMFFIICHHLVIRSAQTCGYTRPFNINEDVLGGRFGYLIFDIVFFIAWLVKNFKSLFVEKIGKLKK
ncbi:hypothetical protein [Bacteroides ovatus]|uniref:hypothetical protein n=1 Tax=Bacteroides ovatus TaxID=28116 RepID=UPI002164E196|nr:hypothetical protein [Bacteroides ovatus]MCS2678974.1 hypothetical protein [Bacteroides ovatus]MCS3254943.1 hypothetical protein [Bacteroides ovatus]UVR37841.1 hypothetical protein NXV29_22470 [Bacteroides ovatus]